MESDLILIQSNSNLTKFKFHLDHTSYIQPQRLRSFSWSFEESRPPVHSNGFDLSSPARMNLDHRYILTAQIYRHSARMNLGHVNANGFDLSSPAKMDLDLKATVEMFPSSCESQTKNALSLCAWPLLQSRESVLSCSREQKFLAKFLR